MDAVGVDVVPVLVSATFIEDGNAHPVVGQAVAYSARFSEVCEQEDPDPDLCRWWDVTATPLGDPYRSHPLGGEPRGPWFWPTLLHGPGWTAVWSALRHLEGPARLRGQLYADYDVATGPLARIGGRITRVRVVTQAHTSRLAPDGLRAQLVAGSRAYHDVHTSPLAFACGDRIPPSAPHQPVTTATAPGTELPPDAQALQIGVVVDLELT